MIADKLEVEKKINELISETGPIEVLVNNAGIARNFIKQIHEVDDEKALEEWQVNVLGTIHCIQAVLPGMLQKESGSIINIASIKGIPQLSTMSTFTYAQSKAAVISLTKSMAKTYSGNGIRCNVICPGYVETDQVKLWSEETFKRISEGTLLGRMAQPKEIAPLVLFLASDEAAYITGSEFLIDGGYALKGK